jgi:hypothetical protein
MNPMHLSSGMAIGMMKRTGIFEGMTKRRKKNRRRSRP